MHKILGFVVKKVVGGMGTADSRGVLRLRRGCRRASAQDDNECEMFRVSSFEFRVWNLEFPLSTIDRPELDRSAGTLPVRPELHPSA
ncbi:MAG: hypothetical protein DMG81_13885 [Acidobacteria bacterium]|nr:MAG: hypothetical protein DMG81_13885 [Acidobacteriota bacterium]